MHVSCKAEMKLHEISNIMKKRKVFIELVAMRIQLNLDNTIRGGSRISVKGVYMYKGVGYAFADLISFS